MGVVILKITAILMNKKESPDLVTMSLNDSKLTRAIDKALLLRQMKQVSVTRPRAIKLFSCSTQLSIKIQLLIKTKMLKKIGVSGFKGIM